MFTVSFKYSNSIKVFLLIIRHYKGNQYYTIVTDVTRTFAPIGLSHAATRLGRGERADAPSPQQSQQLRTEEKKTTCKGNRSHILTAPHRASSPRRPTGSRQIQVPRSRSAPPVRWTPRRPRRPRRSATARRRRPLPRPRRLPRRLSPSSAASGKVRVDPHLRFVWFELMCPEGRLV